MTRSMTPGAYVSPQGAICYSDCAYLLSGVYTTSNPNDPEDDPTVTFNYSPRGEICGTGDQEPDGDVDTGTPGSPPPNTIGGENEEGNSCTITGGMYVCTSAPGNPGEGTNRCYRTDGYPTPCPGTPNYQQPMPRCDWVAGDYVCLDPGEHATCGYVQGNMVCFPPVDEETGSVGGPIPPTSPDHPVNGGNGNGNDRDDPTSGTQTPPDQGDVVDEQRLANLIGNRLDPGLKGIRDQVRTEGDQTQERLDGIGDGIDDLNDGIEEITDLLEGDAIDFAPVPGTFDAAIAAAQGELDTVNGQLEAMMGTVSDEASALLDFDISGGGELPCWNFTAMEAEYEICMVDYADQMALIGSGLLMICMVFGTLMIIRT